MRDPCAPIETSSLKPAIDVASVSPRPAHPRATRGKVTNTTAATRRITPTSPPVVNRRFRPSGISLIPWRSAFRRRCPTMSARVESDT